MGARAQTPETAFWSQESISVIVVQSRIATPLCAAIRKNNGEAGRPDGLASSTYLRL